MKRISILPLILLVAMSTACQQDNVRSLGREYIMFQDTLSLHAVVEDQESFTVPVTSTVACDYDRTIAVEIIDSDSDAIEGRDYRLASNTIVIPAGELRTDVVVYPDYDRFEINDTISFKLKLVMPEQLRMDMYGDETKVSMFRVCPFDINSFTGWCVVTSTFLYTYPGLDNTDGSYQRLIRTTLDETAENTVILHDWLFDGYDVKIVFDPSDPLNQTVSLPEDQLITNEEFVFGQINGDNRILGMTSPAYVSYFNSCESFAALWMRAYVYNIDTLVGNVGDFYNIMEWVSDEEADRLQKEEGM